MRLIDVILLASLAACASPHLEVPMTTSAEIRVDPSLLATASSVAEGAIVSVGSPPEYDAGEAPALQPVEIEVQSVLKGPLTVGARVTFDVLVVGGASLVVVGADGVTQLDPALLRPGVRVRVYARQVGGGWRVLEQQGGLTIR